MPGTMASFNDNTEGNNIVRHGSTNRHVDFAGISCCGSLGGDVQRANKGRHRRIRVCAARSSTGRNLVRSSPMWPVRKRRD